MKIEHDFSKGERGKFYSPDATFSFPTHLEPDVNKLAQESSKKRNGCRNLLRHYSYWRNKFRHPNHD